MSGSSKEVTYSLAAPVSQKDPVSQKETQDVEMTAGIPGLSSIMSPRNSAKGPYTPFTPKKQEFAQDIIWSKVNFKVGEKDILQDCYGSVPAGKVAAILGPSGAGKSSLLNVLAGRSSSGKNISISAEVAVAGKKIDPVEFRKRIAYVMQEDALLPTATPREALRFSGMLRLDPADHKDLNEKVEFVLDELGLVDCADTYIGGALIKGISGGQKKRTSIGVEIITEPALLFLDEPTSGLDSYSAFTCVSLFKRIAETDAAVLCTIHQPSSEVFALFDIAIFMQSGRILYQGPTENIVPYFAKFGYKCPINYNPSDFVMFLAQTETVEQITETGLYGANDEVRSSIETRIQPLPKLEKLPKVVEPSTFLQTYLLTKRECVNTYRDVGALVGRFGISSVLSLIYGLIFLGAGDRNDANINNFQDHFGAVTFLTISCMFGSSQSVLLAFPYERPLFLRENSTGTYSAMVYFLSKCAIELPLTFLQQLVSLVICYFMMGLNGNFGVILVVFFALGSASCSVAIFLGSIVTDVKDAAELSTLLFVPQLLFAGFFIRTEQIPVFMRWAQYLCSLKYALNLILLEEFNEDNSECQGAAADNCASALDSNDVYENQTWVYALLLIVLFVSFRAVGAYILSQKAKKFY